LFHGQILAGQDIHRQYLPDKLIQGFRGRVKSPQHLVCLVRRWPDVPARERIKGLAGIAGPADSIVCERTGVEGSTQSK
jgi:hypothetical protein